ncbi:glycosyltransferase family 4 protein [Candidatus Woesearchaeota archaeon]|nr:glycosyltransferase family 4 protein [Candidatus Woesearchaeota archaeon]
MKIVHAVGYFVPELGYQEYYLAKKHREMGHDVHVITSDMLYPFPDIEEMLKEAGAKDTSRKRKAGLAVIDGIKVHRLRHFFEYSDFIACGGFKECLKKIRPDIVFSHESRQAFTLPAAFYKKKIGYRLIVDQHDFYHKIPKHPITKKILRFLDYNIIRRPIVNYCLSKADRVVAVTQETKDFLVKSHGIKPSRIKLIPLGVDMDFFRFNGKKREELRKKLGFRDKDTVLVFSGTIVRRKGLELLLNALAEMKEGSVKLLIVGGGESAYISELKALAKKNGLEGRIAFTGFVDKKKVKDYFSAADVGVWPGNNSVSIIEAMACSLPIIIVDLQLSHLVSFGNGIKFRQNDKEGLKDAILKIAKDHKLRKSMALNSLKAAKENYSYDKIAAEFLRL